MKVSQNFSKELIAELERREANYLSGKSKLLDWEAVLRKMRKKISERKEKLSNKKQI